MECGLPTEFELPTESPRRGRSRQAGFTILEVLIALALFSVVILVVLAPLTGLFGLTQRSTDQIVAVNSGQQVIEQIRGQWLNSTRYDKGCIDRALSAPGVVSVTLQDENLGGEPITSPAPLATAADCRTADASSAVSAAAPPLRKVTVVTRAGNATSTLSVEVAR